MALFTPGTDEKLRTNCTSVQVQFHRLPTPKQGSYISDEMVILGYVYLHDNIELESNKFTFTL